MADKTRIRFLQDYAPRAAPTEHEEPRTYKKDEEVDFLEEYKDDAAPAGQDAERHRAERAAASAKHFVNRKLAVYVGEEGEEVAPARPRAAQQTRTSQQAATQQPAPRAEPKQGPGVEAGRAPLAPEPKPGAKTEGPKKP